MVWYHLPDLHPHRSTMPEHVHLHRAMALNGKSFIDNNFFFLERQRLSGPAGSLLHILSTNQSQTWEKKGTPTLCCNFTQPPSAFIWSVTGEIIHQPQLLCDPLILFLSLTLFLCIDKELKGERLSFFVMLLWEGGYCCDCRDNRKKCSWILHLCIHFFKNKCQQVSKEHSRMIVFPWQKCSLVLGLPCMHEPIWKPSRHRRQYDVNIQRRRLLPLSKEPNPQSLPGRHGKNGFPLCVHSVCVQYLLLCVCTWKGELQRTNFKYGMDTILGFTSRHSHRTRHTHT